MNVKFGLFIFFIFLVRVLVLVYDWFGLITGGTGGLHRHDHSFIQIGQASPDNSLHIIFIYDILK